MTEIEVFQKFASFPWEIIVSDEPVSDGLHSRTQSHPALQKAFSHQSLLPQVVCLPSSLSSSPSSSLLLDWTKENHMNALGIVFLSVDQLHSCFFLPGADFSSLSLLKSLRLYFFDSVRQVFLFFYAHVTLIIQLFAGRRPPASGESLPWKSFLNEMKEFLPPTQQSVIPVTQPVSFLFLFLTPSLVLIVWITSLSHSWNRREGIWFLTRVVVSDPSQVCLDPLLLHLVHV